MTAPSWTSFPLHASARRVYVSKSGSDANDGLSTSTPKLTLAAGYALLRDGFGDHLLLNRGDTWTGETISGNGNEKSGLSSAYPQLFSAYGTGARPVIDHDGARLRDESERADRELRDMIHEHIAAPAHAPVTARLEAIEDQLIHRRDDADRRFEKLQEEIAAVRERLAASEGCP